MYKICLLLLVISSPLYPMLSRALLCVQRAPSVAVFSESVQQNKRMSDRAHLEAVTEYARLKDMIKYDSKTLKHALTIFPDAFRHDYYSLQKILEEQAGFSYSSFRDPCKELTFSEQQKLLTKIMIIVNAGAKKDFYLTTGGTEGAGFWHGPGDGCAWQTKFSHLSGDWTNGRFTALAEYFHRVHELRFDDRFLSAEQQKVVIDRTRDIMKMYNIKEEDVTVVPKSELESSRIQAAE